MFVDAEKPRHNFARCWLRDMREQHLVMPNRDLTVLPWSSAWAVHPLYHPEEEHENLDPTSDWADAATNTRQNDEKRCK